ncbi:MAG TPA: acyl-CoA dehydrogenase family protein [Dehalococcoidia bacterium]|nr:acyl-CoA dehydrogenase family protein [Dehalococcoidia bacterium]
MKTPTIAELADRAEDMLPALKQRAARAEAEGRLPQETIDEFKEAGFLRVFVPRRYGGLELDYGLTQVELCNQIGRACGSSAWVFSVVTCHAWLLGMMPEPAQEAVWSTGPDTLMTTAVSPSTGKIRRVEGGYLLNGRWQFSSGCDFAEWILLSGPLEGEQRRAPWCLVHKRDFEIDHDSWHPMGLAGTGSKDVDVKDAFVPEAWTSGWGARPGASLHESYIYRIPFIPFFFINTSSPALGVARGAVEEYVSQMNARPGPPTVGRQMRLAESSAEVDAALSLMRADMNEMVTIGHSEGEMTPEQLARWERDLGYATKLCVQAVDRLLPAVGAHAIDVNNPIHRAGRDIHAISTHACNWDPRGLAYARWAFGLEPESAFG